MRFSKSSQKHLPSVHMEEIMGSAPRGEVLRVSITRKVFQVFYVLVVLATLIFVGRILFLSYSLGSFYTVRAKQNANQEVLVRAERGVIFDRFQKPLAQNQPIFSASLKISEYLKNREMIESFLSETLGLTPADLGEALSKADLANSDSIIVARDLEPEKIIALKSRDIPGLEIEDDFRRYYPQKDVFSHVLGYVNYESIGKTNLEAFYNDHLKGQDGTIVRERNSNGEVLSSLEIMSPTDGKNLTLTIDLEFQQYFYDRLLAGLKLLDRTSGVGLALDPRNGEILAEISFPSYDNNLFTKRGNKNDQAERYSLLASSQSPLFNRSISGMYNPASTIKPLDAVAALTEKVITTDYGVYSPGYLEIPNPYVPGEFSRFLDWRPQGWVNVYSAIAKSSNVYFYEVGGGFGELQGLGINRLNEWWRKFGLGSKTGVDFPGESEGFLPNPDEKEKRTGRIWRIGDTYNVSIGQGDLLVTPLQLLNYISAIANGGYLYKPHFNKNLEPRLIADLSFLYPQIKEVQLGMIDGVRKPYGTSFLLRDLPVMAAAKTGSAQISNNTKTNAFFVGYEPAFDYTSAMTKQPPEIAVLVLIENAKEGSLNAVPIGRDVLNWYYEHRIKQL